MTNPRANNAGDKILNTIFQGIIGDLVVELSHLKGMSKRDTSPTNFEEEELVRYPTKKLRGNFLNKTNGERR